MEDFENYSLLLIHVPFGFADVTCKEPIAVDGACLTVIERGEQWLHDVELVSVE